MKIILVDILMIILLSSCNQVQEDYENETCVGMREVDGTDKFSINDTLPGFGATTRGGTAISLSELDQNRLFLFYKSKECPLEGFVNNEIIANGLGELATEKGFELYILKDPKSAKYYGISDGGEIKNSTLFILKDDLIIEKIYQNICEDEIAELIKHYE